MPVPNTNALSLHRYLYAYQNPTVYVDPDGRQSLRTQLEEIKESAAGESFARFFLANSAQVLLDVTDEVVTLGTLGELAERQDADNTAAEALFGALQAQANSAAQATRQIVEDPSGAGVGVALVAADRLLCKRLCDTVANAFDRATDKALEKLTGSRISEDFVDPDAVRDLEAGFARGDGVVVQKKLFTAKSIFNTFPERTIFVTTGIDDQAQFLSKNVPGLSEKQAKSILEKGFRRNSTIVFGGSRVRGGAFPFSGLSGHYRLWRIRHRFQHIPPTGFIVGAQHQHRLRVFSIPKDTRPL